MVVSAVQSPGSVGTCDAKGDDEGMSDGISEGISDGISDGISLGMSLCATAAAVKQAPKIAKRTIVGLAFTDTFVFGPDILGSGRQIRPPAVAEQKMMLGRLVTLDVWDMERTLFVH